MAVTPLARKKGFWERHPRFDIALTIAMVVATIIFAVFVFTKGFGYL